jgi:PAS domain S-box-containing protein
MGEEESLEKRYANLRRRAEKLLEQRDQIDPTTLSGHYIDMIHGLEVFRSELRNQYEELHRARQQLRQSKDRYSRLFDFAPVGYVTLTRDGLIDKVNRVAAGMLGRSADHLKGQSLARFIHDTDIERFDRHKQAVIDTEKRHIDEIRLKSSTGRIIHVRMGSLLDVGYAGDELRILMSLANIEDVKRREAELQKAHALITHQLEIRTDELQQQILEHHQIERALEDSQKKYQVLVRHATEGIVITQDNKIRFVNPNIAEVLGYSEENLLSRSFADFIHPDDRQTFLGYHKARLRSEQAPLEYDFRIVDTKGQIRWLRCLAVVIDWKGSLASLKFLRDITARKEAEAELAEKKDMLQKILDNIPVMVCVYDPDGQVSMINRETEKMLGWTFEEFCHLDVMATCYPDPELRRKVWQFMCEAPDAWMDIPIKTKWDTTFDTSWYNIRLEGELHVGIGIDISERTRRERELKRATEELAAERSSLKDKNVALRELLSQIEQGKDEIKQRILTNFEESALPLLRRIQESSEGYVGRSLKLLEAELVNVTSPFISHLKSSFPALSPRQQEVCRMIKGGMTTKEIAASLNVAPSTIQKQRELIRKKLGLSGAPVNLTTYLQKLDRKRQT